MSLLSYNSYDTRSLQLHRRQRQSHRQCQCLPQDERYQHQQLNQPRSPHRRLLKNQPLNRYHHPSYRQHRPRHHYNEPYGGVMSCNRLRVACRHPSYHTPNLLAPLCGDPLVPRPYNSCCNLNRKPQRRYRTLSSPMRHSQGGSLKSVALLRLSHLAAMARASSQSSVTSVGVSGAEVQPTPHSHRPRRRPNTFVRASTLRVVSRQPLESLSQQPPQQQHAWFHSHGAVLFLCLGLYEMIGMTTRSLDSEVKIDGCQVTNRYDATEGKDSDRWIAR